MTKLTQALLVMAAAFSFLGCSSTPKYEKISSKYVGCDAKDLKPVEITNHGWYQSWYVDCGGQEYFCRYSGSNEGGWNGCHVSQAD